MSVFVQFIFKQNYKKVQWWMINVMLNTVKYTVIKGLFFETAVAKFKN